MPRTLPWKRAVVPAGRSSTSASSPATGERPAKRRKENDTKEDVNTTGASPRACRLQKNSMRSPSTSPPPTPPSQEPMRPADDAWMMVEDEFYAIAQSFTKHLHWTEYKRLKERAAQKKLEFTLIDRPVDGRSEMSTELKIHRKHEVSRQQIAEIARTMKLKNGDLVFKDQESGEEDEILIGDRNLAGLMLGGGKHKTSQRTILHGNTKSTNTRAAAGFEKQKPKKQKAHFAARLYDIPGVKKEDLEDYEKDIKHEDTDAGFKSEDGDDDDLDNLDRPLVRPSRGSVAVSERAEIATVLPFATQATTRNTQITQHHTFRDMSVHLHGSMAPLNTKITATSKTTMKVKAEPLDFGGFTKSKAMSTGVLDRVKARALMKKSANEKSIKLEEIPAFLM